jgi:hypothetical protein
MLGLLCFTIVIIQMIITITNSKNNTKDKILKIAFISPVLAFIALKINIIEPLVNYVMVQCQIK